MANEQYTAAKALLENQYKDVLAGALAEVLFDWSGDTHNLELPGLLPGSKVEVTLKYRSPGS